MKILVGFVVIVCMLVVVVVRENLIGNPHRDQIQPVVFRENIADRYTRIKEDCDISFDSYRRNGYGTGIGVVEITTGGKTYRFVYNDNGGIIKLN